MNLNTSSDAALACRRSPKDSFSKLFYLLLKVIFKLFEAFCADTLDMICMEITSYIAFLFYSIINTGIY